MTFLKRGNNRYLIHLLMLVLCFTYLLFIADGLFTIDSIFLDKLDFPNYFILFAIGVLLFSSYLFFVYRRFEIGLNYPILALCTALFVIEIIGILSFKGVNDTGDIIYSLNAEQKIEFIMNGLLFSCGIYVFIGAAPQCVRSVHFGRIIAYLIIGFASVLVIYSLIKEFPMYINFLKTGPSDAYEAPKSFTWNRNSYAYWILFGTLSCYYVYYTNRKLWWWIPISIFSVLQIITMSKTCIIVQALTVLVMVVHFLATSFKKHKIVCILMCLVIVAGIVLVVWKAGPLLSLLRGAASDTIDDRLVIWNDTMDLLDCNRIGWVFGVGGSNFAIALNYENLGQAGLASVDSGIYDILGRYGIIGLILYAAFIGYIVYLFVKARKNKFPYLLPTILLLAMVLLHGLAEITNLFTFSMRGSAAICLILIPLQRSLIGDKIEVEENESSPAFDERELIKISFLFETLPFSILVGVGYNKFNFSSPLEMVLGILLYITIPFVFVGIYRKMCAKKNAEAIVSIVLIIASLALYFIGGILKSFTLYFFIASIVLLGALIFITIYKNGKIPLMLKDSWPYFATFTLVVVIDMLCNYFVQHYPYYFLMMLSFNASVFVLGFVASPYASYSLYFSKKIDIIEYKAYALEDAVVAKLNTLGDR